MYDHILYIYNIYNMYIMRIFYKRIICTCLCLCFQQARLHLFISYENEHALKTFKHQTTRGGPGRDHRVGLFYASSLEGDGEYQMKLRVKGETAGEGWVNMSFFFQTQTYPLVILT